MCLFLVCQGFLFLGCIFLGVSVCCCLVLGSFGFLDLFIFNYLLLTDYKSYSFYYQLLDCWNFVLFIIIYKKIYNVNIAGESMLQLTKETRLIFFFQKTILVTHSCPNIENMKLDSIQFFNIKPAFLLDKNWNILV